MLFSFFFFFKQKTAYEMRISDWSSDVCSSDLGRAHDPPPARPAATPRPARPHPPVRVPRRERPARPTPRRRDGLRALPRPGRTPRTRRVHSDEPRSAERRVGKERVSTCSTGWSPCPKKKKKQQKRTHK